MWYQKWYLPFALDHSRLSSSIVGFFAKFYLLPGGARGGGGVAARPDLVPARTGGPDRAAPTTHGMGRIHLQ